MEELGGEGREEGGGEEVGAPFNVLPPGATDLVVPLFPTCRHNIYFKTHQRFTLHSVYTHAKVGKEKCMRTEGSVG